MHHSYLLASKSKTMDYRGEMNSDTFRRWVCEKLLPNFEEPSLIVMDNAPYHSNILNKQPTSSWKKLYTINWLQENKIHFENSMRVPELLNIARNNKIEPIYEIDEVMRKNGHEVLRLPPYHCQFNAIELIWVNCKKYYNQHIGRDGYSHKSVIDMWNEALNHCDSKIWENCVRHTEDIIKEWHNRDILLYNECAL